MVEIEVYQYVDKDWRYLGNLQQSTKAIAQSLLGELQETIMNPNLVYLPLRQHAQGLLVVNLQLGAVKFYIRE